MWFAEWILVAVLASGVVMEVPVHGDTIYSTEWQCVQSLPKPEDDDYYKMKYRLNVKCAPVYWNPFEGMGR